VSLKLRAALLFIPVYLATFFAGFLFLSSSSLSVAEDHHIGPRMAIAFAADDLNVAPAGVSIEPGGPFSELRAGNAAMWMIVEQADGRILRIGRPPPAALAMAHQLYASAEAADFHVPGVTRPLSDASYARLGTELGDVGMTAGGIDPARISLAHTLRYFLDQGLFLGILFLGILGTIILLVTLPLLTRSVRRLTGHLRAAGPAAAIPAESVPRELRKLVAALNAALASAAEELAARRRLLASVAHELRTPLATLSLQAERLAQGEGRRDIERGLFRLNNLVGQMLDVERYSLAGSEAEPFRVGGLARDLVAEVAPLAIASGYDIEVEVERDFEAVGDERAISRAATNLVSNAIAYGGEQGLIRVVVSKPFLDIVDPGPGIDPDLLPIIFDAFQRGRVDRDGCGLGLHLAREIMRAQGGDLLHVASDEGTTFRMRFDDPAPPADAGEAGEDQ
jgi:signal transduction histidine kinase